MYTKTLPIAMILLASCSPLGPKSLTDGPEDAAQSTRDVTSVAAVEATTADIKGAIAQTSFPAERDLAILFPLGEDPLVRADQQTDAGQPLLSYNRLRMVADAFDGTGAQGALFDENIYDDWRLVSMRVVPCGPIARSPALAPASVCWPVVRLVWQPVVPSSVNLWGFVFDAFADDRAIHAIYPVQPRSADGAFTEPAALDTVMNSLEAGRPASSLSDQEMLAFELLRDQTAAYLLSELQALRDPYLPADSWTGMDVRPELNLSETASRAFLSRLNRFLSDFASPRDLREMTAFSLPTGRNPAGDDAWVFVQFASDGQTMWQRELEVYSRTDGDLLLNYGLEQTAGQTSEAPAVSDALWRDLGSELHDTVVESSTEIAEIADLVNDPTKVFVPNTTCATCHRLNDLRFNFHNLSHLEDRPHTVSPRVVADVEHELAWTSAWASQAPGAATSPSETALPEAAEDWSGDLEPNETPAQATQIAVPFEGDLAITPLDDDYFAFDWSGGEIDIAITLASDAGDLDLALVDLSGTVIAASTTTSSQEQLQLDLPAGQWVVRVYGYSDATGDYRLTVRRGAL